MSDFEKDQLLEAGLGEKEVEFSSLNMAFEEVKEVLLEEFPRLKGGGGFQFLKGLPNSRSLEPLSKAFYTLLRVLKQRVGQGRTYIRRCVVPQEYCNLLCPQVCNKNYGCVFLNHYSKSGRSPVGSDTSDAAFLEVNTFV